MPTISARKIMDKSKLTAMKTILLNKKSRALNVKLRDKIATVAGAGRVMGETIASLSCQHALCLIHVARKTR